MWASEFLGRRQLGWSPLLVASGSAQGLVTEREQTPVALPTARAWREWRWLGRPLQMRFRRGYYAPAICWVAAVAQAPRSAAGSSARAPWATDREGGVDQAGLTLRRPAGRRMGV